MANYLNITDSSLIYILENKNIKIKNVTRNKNILSKNNNLTIDNLLVLKDDIILKYEETSSIIKTANHFNCSRWCIYKLFNHIKYDYRKNNFSTFWEYKDLIIEQYFMQMKSLVELGKIYKCSSVKMGDFIKKQGYTLRTKQYILKNNPYGTDYSLGKYIMSRLKEYTLPSGNVIRLQGYEPNFLNYVFENKIFTEDQIEYNPKRINYQYENRNKYYYPDFYIPHLNLIVEIKSEWILNLQGFEINKAKEQAAIDNGYQFVQVLDNDFSVLEKFNKYNYDS